MLTLLNLAEISIQWDKVGIAIGILAGAALVLSLLIVGISRLCRVEEDPRIKEVNDLLAGANCGACGYPGCSGFAKALVEGKADLSACGQTNAHNKIEISNILGTTVQGDTEPTVAVVACSGGNKCKDKFAYQGYGDCVSQNMLANGRKACETGCMGSGTCVKACPYSSIDLVDGVAKVDPDLCRSCGICISACPKTLIKRVPVSAKVYVACSTNCRGKDVTSHCEAGCISCGICERNCPTGAIVLVNNVPIIDYSKCINCETCLIKCPRHVIKHIHPQNDVQAETQGTQKVVAKADVKAEAKATETAEAKAQANEQVKAEVQKVVAVKPSVEQTKVDESAVSEAVEKTSTTKSTTSSSKKSTSTSKSKSTTEDK